MRIIFICNELPPAPAGGIGRFVSILAPKLSDLGHEVHVVGVYKRHYHWSQQYYDVHVAIPKVSLIRRLLQKTMAAKLFQGRLLMKIQYREICSAIRKQVDILTRIDQPVIVEWPSYEGLCNWTDRMAVDLMRIHGANAMPAYSADPEAEKNRKNEIAAARRIRNWIGVSQWSLDEWERVTGIVPEMKRVIYNPVDCQLFCPSKSQPASQTVLYAGTLCERKGDVRLAKAANKFLSEYKQSRLLYVGKHNPERARTVFSAVRPELRNRIEIMPEIDQEELAKTMQKAAVFVMPSRGETFGMVYAEAMACGVPVVAGNITAIPEIVPHEKAGFLVDADDVSAISAAVISLLKSSELRARMGEYGRRITLEKYSVESCVNNTIDFYNHCIQKKKSKRII